MDIISIEYEESLFIRIGETAVKIIAFKTQEPGNIKFGVDAPRTIGVHREEIYHAIQQKKLLESVE